MTRGKSNAQEDHFSEKGPAFPKITNVLYCVVKYLMTFARIINWRNLKKRVFLKLN